MTSFVGRAAAVDDVAGLLSEYRLVTVTGPGGVGKTRLAGEVAERVAGRFADGVWLVELTAVTDPAQVPSAVAAALGVGERPGVPVSDVLAGVLASRQVLLVLDNCEHVIAAVARLCGALLSAADDVRVLATSREPVGVSGEARYRLPPLSLPEGGGRAEASRSDAVVLFTDRARRVDPHFTLNEETGPLVARLVQRLDGVPLAIELAAARVEAVAGADAGPVVLRLVDCSLLVPPRTWPDGRARYVMLDTLRTYAAGQLAEAGERPAAAAALVRYTLQVAEQAAAGMQVAAAEPDAAGWLDAEDVTVQQGLTWALQHDPDVALRLVIALAPWWHIRGRLVAGYAPLRAVAGHATPGSDLWGAAHYWLGQAAHRAGDFAAALGYFTAVRDAAADTEPQPVLVDALAGRSVALVNINRIPEGIEDARRAVALARETGYRAGEALALANLSLGAYYAGDLEDALAWAGQAKQVDPAAVPGWIARRCNDFLILILLGTGDLSSARQCCEEGLAQAQQAGDPHGQALCLGLMADMDQQAGRIPEAGGHLRESLELATRIGDPLRLLNGLDSCGHLCAATQRWAQAVTVWAAYDAQTRDQGLTDLPQDAHRRHVPLRRAGQVLGPDRIRAAQDRGAAMTLATAVEFVAMLVAADPP